MDATGVYRSGRHKQSGGSPYFDQSMAVRCFIGELVPEDSTRIEKCVFVAFIDDDYYNRCGGETDQSAFMRFLYHCSAKGPRIVFVYGRLVDTGVVCFLDWRYVMAGK